MAETPSGGATFNFGNSTFNAPVFNNSVFHEAVHLAQGLGAPPQQEAALVQALEALGAKLAAVPDDKRPLADKAAESAKEVVAAAKPGGDESLFRGAVRSLRGWAEDIAKTVPAVSGAAEQVIKLAGQVRGWLPPGLG